jgi:hypothetical protein
VGGWIRSQKPMLTRKPESCLADQYRLRRDWSNTVKKEVKRGTAAYFLGLAQGQLWWLWKGEAVKGRRGDSKG